MILLVYNRWRHPFLPSKAKREKTQRENSQYWRIHRVRNSNNFQRFLNHRDRRKLSYPRWVATSSSQGEERGKEGCRGDKFVKKAIWAWRGLSERGSIPGPFYLWSPLLVPPLVRVERTHINFLSLSGDNSTTTTRPYERTMRRKYRRGNPHFRPPPKHGDVESLYREKPRSLPPFIFPARCPVKPG